MSCKNCLSGRLGVVGFTLIELLVVVLIIGILAAVALPQYQKAVGRAQMAEGIRILKTIAQSAERYRLATGSYPEKLADMDVEIPWTGTQKGRTHANVKDTRSNKDWSLQTFNGYPSQSQAIMMTRLSGKYKGGQLTWIFYFGQDPSQAPFLACHETKSGEGEVVFNGSEGEFCVKLMRGRAVEADPNHWWYAINF